MVAAALGRLFLLEQVLDGFTTKFGSTKDAWVRVPSQTGNTGCVSEELSNQRFIGKGHLPLGQLVSLCGEGVGGRKRWCIYCVNHHLLKPGLLKRDS